MPINARCQCGARFAAPDQLAGRKVKCPQCSEPVAVPSASGSSKPAGQPIAVHCECGKGLKVPAKYAGKSLKCPACGAPISVPSRASKPPANSDDANVANLLDEVELNISKTGRRCPECRHDMQIDDVICVNCGFNSETGKKIQTRKVERGKKIGNVVVHDAKKAKADAPPPVMALVKLLNQAGAVALLMAVVIVGYLGYQKMQSDPNLGTDAFLTVLKGSGGYILGAAVVLITIPCALAANMVQSGHAAGRILSIVVGVLSLAGLPILTLLGVLILKLAFSDEVSRFCS